VNVMNKKIQKKIINPTCVGTGLISLDLVMNGSGEKTANIFTGGSCGNVLSILSFLGWNTYPVGYLGDNIAYDEIHSDLKNFKVKTKLLLKESDGRTPIIGQRSLSINGDQSSHLFFFRCPTCGRPFPKHKPPPKELVIKTLNKISKPTVFYFDRVSDSSFELAKSYNKRGTIIFFEPSRIKNLDLFRKCLDVATIVKFSHHNIRDGRNIMMNCSTPLLIETFGKDGLKYGIKLPQQERKWTHIQGFAVSDLVDAAGAGDWCSAGFLNRIINKAMGRFSVSYNRIIEEGLIFSQAVAALSCHFEGARGMMYKLTKSKMIREVDRILKGYKPINISGRIKNNNVKNIRNYCICNYFLSHTK
jgi:sugar/nucleoside kinase (ribokinase family)